MDSKITPAISVGEDTRPRLSPYSRKINNSHPFDHRGIHIKSGNPKLKKLREIAKIETALNPFKSE
jgi:hypothetical protein